MKLRSEASGKHLSNIAAPRHPLKILALESGRTFANKICDHLKKNDSSISISPSKEITFANGEFKYIVSESIRGADVYIVQLIDDPLSKKSVNDNLMALACAINAAYYSDAHSITAVIPQFPYARQDKRKGREPITARIVGDLLHRAGATRAITLDIHSEAIEGFFAELKLENLHMGRLLIEYVKAELLSENLMVVAPDVNSAKRGGFFAKALDTELAIIAKSRDYAKISVIDSMRLVGNVSGRNILICDDMLATGGTLLNACQLLKNEGAQRIYAAVALPFFNADAAKKFAKAYTQKEKLFDGIIGSNAVNRKPIFSTYPWYHEIDVTKLFADVIYNLTRNASVSELLE